MEGKQVPFSDEELGTVTDWARVRKVYKLSLVGQQGKKKGMGEEEKREEEERERKELGLQVLGAMALRGAS